MITTFNMELTHKYEQRNPLLLYWGKIYQPFVLDRGTERYQTSSRPFESTNAEREKISILYFTHFQSKTEIVLPVFLYQ